MLSTLSQQRKSSRICRLPGTQTGKPSENHFAHSPFSKLRCQPGRKNRIRNHRAQQPAGGRHSGCTSGGQPLFLRKGRSGVPGVDGIRRLQKRSRQGRGPIRRRRNRRHHQGRPAGAGRHLSSGQAMGEHRQPSGNPEIRGRPSGPSRPERRLHHHLPVFSRSHRVCRTDPEQGGPHRRRTADPADDRA